MLLTLLATLAMADVPPPPQPVPIEEKEPAPPTEEAASEPGLTAELRVPAATEGKVPAGERVSLVLSFHNQGEDAAATPIDGDTIHVTDTVGDTSKDLEVAWSMGEVKLDPGALAAAFGGVLLAPGEHELKLWFTPAGGEPSGEPTSVVKLAAE